MSNEWYTPKIYVDAARDVMGNIELDPASCRLANETVQATRFYTKEEDGLAQEWRAESLFMNPPYGRIYGKGGSESYQKLFVEKLLSEFQAGNVGQAILLSLGNPNSVWFQPLFEFPLCFHRSNIWFYRPDGSQAKFGFPNAFVYLGPHEEKFIEVFKQFGPVVQRRGL